MKTCTRHGQVLITYICIWGLRLVYVVAESGWVVHSPFHSPNSWSTFWIWGELKDSCCDCTVGERLREAKLYN